MVHKNEIIDRKGYAWLLLQYYKREDWKRKDRAKRKSSPLAEGVGKHTITSGDEFQ